MKCRKVQRKLSAYLDCELDGAVSREIAAHLDVCSVCRREFEAFSGVDVLVRDAFRYSLSADLSKELMATLQKADSSPSRPQGNPRGFHQIRKVLQDFLEGYYELLQAQRVPEGTRSLDEFDDIPSSFIGHAYFKILGTQTGEVS